MVGKACSLFRVCVLDDLFDVIVVDELNEVCFAFRKFEDEVCSLRRKKFAGKNRACMVVPRAVVMGRVMEVMK